MILINTQPAYGREYKSKKEAIAAWEQCKDFIVLSVYGNSAIQSGVYLNKIDFSQLSFPGDTVQCKLSDGVYTILARKEEKKCLFHKEQE